MKERRPLSVPISLYKIKCLIGQPVHVLIRDYSISNDNNNFGVKRLFDYS